MRMLPTFSRVRSVLCFSGTAGLFAASMMVSGSMAASAAAVCTAPAAPAAGSVAKNIDTTQGCNVTTGNATNPATGFIAVTMPAGQTTTAMADLFQSGPGGTIYAGPYIATFSACVGGTATPGTYTISSSGTVAGGTASFWTALTAGGTITCQYSVAFAGTAPAGVTTLQNVAGFQGNAFPAPVFGMSAVVQTFAAPPVPEAPFAIALPLAGLLITGGFVGWSRRRLRRQSRAVRP